MKRYLKKLVFGICHRIVNISEQHRNEIVYQKFNLSNTVRIHGVDLQGKVSIGEYSYINLGTRISAIGESKVVIGKHCAIGRYVHISSYTHSNEVPTSDDNYQNNVNISKDVKIGDYVWIGDKVYIGPGIQIGSFAIVGANSVVTKDVKEFEIVGGVPARHIRFNEDHYRYKVNKNLPNSFYESY